MCKGWQNAMHLGKSILPKNIHTSAACLSVQLKMPSLSPTMSEGTIVKWLKNEGGRVEAGDVVCDIQTDKAVVSMEVDDEGILAKIIKPADSGSIKVGELIAVVAEDGEDWKEIASSATGNIDAPISQTSAEPQTSVGSVAGTAVNMPSLSPTMTEGTIVKWYKTEGEAVGAGDLLCDIQTDKAVVSMEADDEGILAKILIQEGASGIQVGTAIAVMCEEGEDWKDVRIPVEGAVAEQVMEVESKPGLPAAAPSVAAAVLPFIHPEKTGPATALLLSQYNIEPSKLTGSGPKGNLVKSDVLNYIEENRLTAVTQQVPLPEVPSKAESVEPILLRSAKPSSGYTDIELTNMRKVIAKRLTDSKQIAPHGYSSATASIDQVSKLRQEYIRSGFKVSINDFVVKAVATALQYVPELNVNVVDDTPLSMPNIDVSVAVATDAGLITPIIKDAANKMVQEISADVKELAGRARENKLKLDEFQGGTFTISNLGMFGITEFTAIINAPQAAILAVGGGRTVINPETMKPETVMTSTLSFDRRFIDEALAADFMAVYKTLIERPELLNAGYLPSVRTDRVSAQVQ